LEHLLTTIDDRGVATLTMNRPEEHNAFDDRLIADLTARLAALEEDPAVRVVVLTGAGRSLSAGADLHWMRRMAGYDQQANLDDALRLAELMRTLDALAKPTIARINGPAYGGGVGLVACCDIAIAGPTASFMFSEVRLGLVPAVISPFVIAAIGVRAARRYMLTAEMIDARQARALGLVHDVADSHEELDRLVEQQIERLLQGGPAALRACKELISEVRHGNALSDALNLHTAETIAALRVSPEGQEGIVAFLERRPAAWRRS
jgi:methylglutaconyl-CoA hydratase